MMHIYSCLTGPDLLRSLGVLPCTVVLGSRKRQQLMKKLVSMQRDMSQRQRL